MNMDDNSGSMARDRAVAGGGLVGRLARHGNAWLTVSALALLGVVVGVAAWPAPASAAREVTQSGDYTALTCDGGNEDILVVLDGRSEQLFVYKVQNQNSVQIMQREDVSRIFGDARARMRGNP